MRARIAAANWKMNTTFSEAIVLANAVKKGAEDVSGVDIVVCPPSTWLYPIKEIYEHRPHNLHLGAQNMFFKDMGAYTGEISPTMLKGFAQYVILGHSERRHIFNEDDELINDKVISALNIGLTPILCIGEKEKKEKSALTRENLNRENGILYQLKMGLKGLTHEKIKDVVVAYEPVWAIGTGDNASASYVNTITNLLREELEESYGKAVADDVSVLYGGSVNDETVGEYANLENVDGVLVGGASLKAKSFLKIAEAIAK